MKRILLSLLVIGGAAALAFGASRAFFSDTETSTGNTFQAGSLDLKISDKCHYWQDGIDIGCPQQLGDPNPVILTNWEATDLNTYHKFFYFNDVKPGDYGENTVDFSITDNPAWMCANISKIEDSDNGFTEPEGPLDSDTQTGELDKFLNFVWWVDDGDNLIGTDEKILYGGPLSLEQLFSTFNAVPLTFADTSWNWKTDDLPMPSPIPAITPQYLGIGWCFGNMTITKGSGIGFTCEAQADDQNASQTDRFVAELSFNVVQHRNNGQFLCPESQKIGRTPVPSPLPQTAPNP